MEKLDSILTKLFGEGGLKRAKGELRLFCAWAKAVDETTTQKARPVSFERGRLKVAVVSPAWLQTLEFRKGEILKSLNRLAPEAGLKDIAFFVGPLPELIPEEGSILK